jgi:hypothetical protein
MKASELIKQEEYYPDYDPYMQLHSLRKVIDALLESSSAKQRDIDNAKVINGYSGERGGDNYADDCCESMYFDAFVSSSIATCVTQYIESVIRYEVRKLLYYDTNQIINLEHKRAKGFDPSTNFDDFWEPSIYWSSKKKRKETNFVLGSFQLMDSIGYLSKLPINFKETLELLYCYRNNVMHNGVEWPPNLRKTFKGLLTRNQHDNFFNWATSGNVQTIAYMENSYISYLLDFCEKLQKAFDSFE